MGGAPHQQAFLGSIFSRHRSSLREEGLSRHTHSLMPASKQQLKDALAAISALVYGATLVPYLDHEQITKLQNALDVISDGQDGDDYFNR